MRNIIIPVLFVVLAFVTQAYAINIKEYRGFNVDHSLNEKDFADLEDIGAKVLRVSFPRQPMLTLTPPYRINEKAFTVLDKYVKLASKYNLKIIVDPHALPGAKTLYTTKPDDLLWGNADIEAAIIKMWGTIAKRYAKYGDVIAGYDLLNEPAPPPLISSGTDRCVYYNSLITRIISEIRKYDKTHPIVVEFTIPVGNKSKFTIKYGAKSCLEQHSDNNIIYSFHMYQPGDFTHQGVMSRKTGILLYKNKDQKLVKQNIMEYMKIIRDFQIEHNVKILVGEFSVSRYAGQEGDLYIQQLLEIFDEYGWGWLYHSFREASVWDPELSVKDLDNNVRNSNSDRMKIIKRALRTP
jgi:hypothetical protein